MCRFRSSLELSLLPWLLAALFLTAPAAVADDTTDATLLAYIEAWNTGELDRLGEVVTADFRRHAGPGESSTSIDGLKELITGSRQLYRRLAIEVEDHVTEDGKGALRGSFFGLYKDTQRGVRFPLMAMYRFEDGKIAEEWMLGDNFAILLALGFGLAPPGAEILPPPEGYTEGPAERPLPWEQEPEGAKGGER